MSLEEQDLDIPKIAANISKIDVIAPAHRINPQPKEKRERTSLIRLPFPPPLPTVFIPLSA